MPALHRTLGLGQCVFFGVGSILGAGIYVLIGKVAGHAGNLTWLAFAIASFTAFLTAFSYAELSAAFPKAGGEYVYGKHAFGQRMATVLGVVIAVNGIISAATVSLGFAGYLTELVPVAEPIAAYGIIALLFLVNASGIKNSSGVNIILTTIEVLGLVLVGVAAWPSAGEADLLTGPEGGTHPLFVAAALSFFAFIGFEEMVKLAEETKDPERTIPRALFIANGIVLLVYVTLAMLVVGAMPGQELAGHHAPLAAIVGTRWGRTGAVLLAVAALFSTCNTLLSNMLGSSRVLFHMGGELRAMRWLSRLSARRTPVTALLLVSGVVAVFASLGDIEHVARLATVTIFLTFLFVNLAVIVLRAKGKLPSKGYRAPLAVGRVPLLAVAGIAMTLLLLGYTLHTLAGGDPG